MSDFRFPECDYSPDERMDAIARLLLLGVTRRIAARKRDNTRRWRAKHAASVIEESRCCAGESEP
jgi:hypothetical protein